MSTGPTRPGKLAGPKAPSPERDALDRILRSEALHRAPNLVLFLRYVCEMQMAGRSDAIKEYNIAVEALGRGVDFDQRKDSIVRVEAHRLRKRLAEYYDGPGANDPVHIVLPAGSYVPVFQTNLPNNGPVVPPDAVPPQLSAQAVRRTPRWVAWSAAAAGVLSVFGAVWISRGSAATAKSRHESEVAAAGQRNLGSTIRLAAGSVRDGFADGSSGTWQADRFFSGGEVVTATARNIRRTTEDALYLTRREGDFEYRIPAPPGLYELRLHFAETVFGEDNVAGGGESSRVFQVAVNGAEPWTADIVSDAEGANTAHIKVYRDVRPAADGLIHIAFRPARKEAAFVNGIEVIPMPDKKLQPIRIVPRTMPLVASSHQDWSADAYWQGGTTVQRHEEVSGPEPSMLYQNERYGHFSYTIPVASGTRYTLTLRFAETWFGQGRPGSGGVGSRVFDVYCNGRTLLKNFDVIREAGAPMRQVKKVFRNVDPTAQGVLNVKFVPIRNYAMVNAIEVTEEDR